MAGREGKGGWGLEGLVGLVIFMGFHLSADNYLAQYLEICCQAVKDGNSF